MFKSHTFFIKI